MASRLSHELRTPVAVVRCSLDNLRLQRCPRTRACTSSARNADWIGSPHPDADDRGHAARTEPGRRSSASASTSPRSSRAASTAIGMLIRRKIVLRRPGGGIARRRRARLIAQMLDKLVANATNSPRGPRPSWSARAASRAAADARLSVENEGPLLPRGCGGGCSTRWSRSAPARRRRAAPRTGLYIVRLIAEFHGGSARERNRDDGRGVVMTLSVPEARSAGNLRRPHAASGHIGDNAHPHVYPIDLTVY